MNEFEPPIQSTGDSLGSSPEGGTWDKEQPGNEVSLPVPPFDTDRVNEADSTTPEIRTAHVVDTPPADERQLSRSRAEREQIKNPVSPIYEPNTTITEHQFRNRPEQALKTLSDISANAPPRGLMREVIEQRRGQLESLWEQKQERRSSMIASLIELGLERLNEVEQGRPELILFDYDRRQSESDLYSAAEVKQTIARLIERIGPLTAEEAQSVQLAGGYKKLQTTYTSPKGVELTVSYVYSPAEILDLAAVKAERLDASSETNQAA